MNERLQVSMGQALRQNSKVGLLFLDLDGFKLIHDTLGHDVGDDLLVQMAKRLSKIVREQDTVA
jgi:diguanylate cyclase (GGDEF)-like protein